MGRLPVAPFHKMRIRLARRGPPSKYFFDIVLLHARRRRDACPRQWLGEYYPTFQSHEETLQQQRRVLLDVKAIREVLAWGATPSQPGILPRRPSYKEERRMPATPTPEQIAVDTATENSLIERNAQELKNIKANREWAQRQGRSAESLQKLKGSVNQVLNRLRRQEARRNGPKDGEQESEEKQALKAAQASPGKEEGEAESDSKVDGSKGTSTD